MTNLIFCIVCIMVCCFTLWKMKILNKVFSNKKKIFVNYLESSNDVETLKRIGEINIFGQREKWVPKYSYVKYWLEKKIEETKDANYIEYLKAYKHFVFQMSC